MVFCSNLRFSDALHVQCSGQSLPPRKGRLHRLRCVLPTGSCPTKPRLDRSYPRMQIPLESPSGFNRRSSSRRLAMKLRLNKSLFTQLVRAQGIEIQLSKSVMEDVTYRVTKGVRYIDVGLCLEQVLLSDNPQKQIVDVVLHEIGHLWVAPRSRRNKRDYGCPPNAAESPHWELEEAKAMLVEHRLGELLRIQQNKDPFHNRTINYVEQEKAWDW